MTAIPEQSHGPSSESPSGPPPDAYPASRSASRPTHRVAYWLSLRLPPALLRDPYAIAVKLGAAVAGALVALRIVPEPTSVVNVLGAGSVLGYLWALMMSFGGVFGLVGLFRGPWQLSSGALWLLVIAFTAYAGMVIETFGLAGAFPALGYVLLAAAAAFRAIAVAVAHLVAQARVDDDGDGNRSRERDGTLP